VRRCRCWTGHIAVQGRLRAHDENLASSNIDAQLSIPHAVSQHSTDVRCHCAVASTDAISPRRRLLLDYTSYSLMMFDFDKILNLITSESISSARRSYIAGCCYRCRLTYAWSVCVDTPYVICAKTVERLWGGHV